MDELTKYKRIKSLKKERILEIVNFAFSLLFIVVFFGAMILTMFILLGLLFSASMKAGFPDSAILLLLGTGATTAFIIYFGLSSIRKAREEFETTIDEIEAKIDELEND